MTAGAPQFDSFYGYNAEDTNPVTGLQYLRARYYDSDSGRFSVADTYLGNISDPLTLNRYSYTTNNPVMQQDPSGHWPEFLDKAVNSVKKAVKTVGKAVKSAINTVKSVVNEYVVQPVKNAVSNAKEKVEKTVQKAKKGYQQVKQAATEFYEENVPPSIQKKVAAAKEKVKKFACGTAEYLSNKWEEAVDVVENIDWKRVAQGAVIVVGGALVVAAGAAAIVATGGMAGAAFAGLAAGAITTSNVVVAGTAIAGYTAFAFGTSDIVEGVHEAKLGVIGDSETVSVNPIRDTVFNNDVLTPEMYYAIEGISVTVATLGTGAINANPGYYKATVGKPSVGTSAGGGSVSNITTTPNESHGLSSKGYNPKPGERTLEGYVKANANPEVSLKTKSTGFNNNNGEIGGTFKRFGSESHGGVSPHVHQPQRNVTPNGDIYGSVGKKTHNGGVTSPTTKDVKQLYEYLNNGKYH